MAADPIQIGVVYVEEDLGSDLHGDLFYVTFDGGAPGTMLQRLTIDGDRDGNGFGIGDLFFDTAPTGLGADESFAFQIVELDTASPDARVSATVEDGGMQLTLQFENFFAGDRLVFSIDVDEVQFYDPNETDLARQNRNFDPITSGVEFQNSILTASFIAPRYEDASGSERFLNFYDDELSPLGLPLPPDNHDGKRDRTAGVGMVLQQTPKPVSLAGNVFVDANENLVREPGERPLAGVRLELYRMVGSTFQPTGHVTTTDANGRYEFPASLGLPAGVYEVREAQPAGYYSVGAIPGRLEGTSVGVVMPGQPDVISRIDLSLPDSHATDLDFAENLPGEISGHVCVAAGSLDCYSADAHKEPLAGVLIELIDESGQVVASQRTDADGNFRFTNLRAGRYRLIEHTPDGLIEGGARAGSLGGTVTGTNEIGQIDLAGGAIGVDYDFCELRPAEISGNTWYDVDADGRREPGEPPLRGVVVTLWDAGGNRIAETTSDDRGYYQFTMLPPGRYRVTEVTPAGYTPGAAVPGTVGGAVRGVADASGDVIDDVLLLAGDSGVNYDFGETLLGSISGMVLVDVNGNCRLDAQGERPLQGVVIQLLDAGGRVIATTQTDANGRYRFDDLMPGTYAVREIQPSGLFHHGQRAGSGGGDDSVADLIQNIPVSGGQDLVEYNFCELEPGSISGIVFADLDFDCVQDPGETSIADVEIALLDAAGNVLATTRTDSNGAYRFDGLRPGEYAVRETQPAGYFHGSQMAPPTGGDDSVADLISAIHVGSGQDIVHADFCEVPPAEITGYVFQDGDIIVTEDGQLPERLRNFRDGQRTPDDRPLAGVTLQLRALNGQRLPASVALPGEYDGPYIEVQTDANGFYRFSGLRAGSYHIYEVHPSGYVDSIDTPGTTTGFAINPGDPVPLTILSLIDLSDPDAAPGTDAILAVAVNPGEISSENNFSEILVEKAQPPAPPPPPPPPEVPKVQPPPPEIFPGLPPITASYVSWSPLPPYIGVGRIPSPTWHLSIINGGFPRGLATDEVPQDVIAEATRQLDVVNWRVPEMEQSEWYLVSTGDTPRRPLLSNVFYVHGARVLAGDFNGDGRDELALFVNGEWFVDLNGNGKWDSDDVWARLGDADDQPVVGDWDGDGKADIGIFGHRWPGDDRALAAEIGLPDAENHRRTRPKNVPPMPEHAPDEPRLLQVSKRGPARADLIDHVFELGSEEDIALAGDFNGDGVATIGVFNDGRWMLDINGDGKITPEHDRVFEMGQPGDLPFVGDFDGDGIDELAVLRGNRLLVDTDGDGNLGPTDQVFELDSNGGLVVVGDFDGDGIDEPIVLRPSAERPDLSARHRDAG